jgi:hypothetical protein
VRDPRASAVVGVLDTPGFAVGVAGCDATTLVADWSGGLRQIDARNRTTPVEISALNLTRHPIDTADCRGYAAVVEIQDGAKVVQDCEATASTR